MKTRFLHDGCVAIDEGFVILTRVGCRHGDDLHATRETAAIVAAACLGETGYRIVPAKCVWSYGRRRREWIILEGQA